MTNSDPSLINRLLIVMITHYRCVNSNDKPVNQTNDPSLIIDVLIVMTNQ